MNYLLDTHAFLWILFDDDKLSKIAQEEIQNPENNIYVSVISYWEISLKYSIGKLELEGINPDELADKACEIDIRTLELSDKESSSFYKLPRSHHKDPFDRLIIWQAIVNGMTLISKDKQIKIYRDLGLKILW